MNSIDKLTELFLKFPGIGIRQARRFVYFLLAAEDSYINELISSLQSLKVETKQCLLCFRFYEEKTEKNVCVLCENAPDTSTLIIVEKDIDLENIRKGGAYFGLYFVLGGLLSPLVKESRSRTRELLNRIKQDGQAKKLQEIIIALGATPNGDYTTLHIQKAISSLSKEHGIRVTTLGRGMSTGTELEYSDADTIKHALMSRK